MLIALGLLYFVGRAYYNLAQRFEKTGWLYAVLGVASYYVGTIVGGIIILLVYEFGLESSFDDANEMAINLMSIPFGVGLCWGLYKLLEHNWSKPSNNFTPDDVLDGNLLDQNQNNFN